MVGFYRKSVRDFLRRSALGAACALALFASGPLFAQDGVPTSCLRFLQSLADHGKELGEIERNRFREIAEAEAGKFSSERLIDFVGKGLGLDHLFDMHPGVKEFPTVRAHTKAVLENFERQYELWKIDELAPKLGIAPERLRALLRTAVSLHDIGKGLAVEAGEIDAQHKYTTPLLGESLRQLNFSEKEIALAKALIDQDYIGQLLQLQSGLPDAIAGLKAAAKQSGLSEADFFRLASALYTSDAFSYAYLRERYFKNFDAKREQTIPDAPAFHALAEAFGVPVPASKLKPTEPKPPQDQTPYWAEITTRGDASTQLAEFVAGGLLVPERVAKTAEMEAALQARAEALRDLKTRRKKFLGDTRFLELGAMDRPAAALKRAKEIEPALQVDAEYKAALAKFEAANKSIVDLVNPHLVPGLRIDTSSAEAFRHSVSRAAAFDGYAPKTAKELLELDLSKVPEEIHRNDDFPNWPFVSNNYQLRKAHFSGDSLVPANEFGGTTPVNHSGQDRAPKYRNDSGFISFSGSAASIARFGHPGGVRVKLKLRELLRDIRDEKVANIDVLTREDLAALARQHAREQMKAKNVSEATQNKILEKLDALATLSKSRPLLDADFRELNELVPDAMKVEGRSPPYLNAVRHMLAADEFLVRGKIPKRYLDVSPIPPS